MLDYSNITKGGHIPTKKEQDAIKNLEAQRNSVAKGVESAGTFSLVDKSAIERITAKKVSLEASISMTMDMPRVSPLSQSEGGSSTLKQPETTVHTYDPPPFSSSTTSQKQTYYVVINGELKQQDFVVGGAPY